MMFITVSTFEWERVSDITHGDEEIQWTIQWIFAFANLSSGLEPSKLRVT